MTLIIPRFYPGPRLFHELSPKSRQRLIECSVRIGQGRLREMPIVSPSGYPWLGCLIVTDGLPQLIICETWDDVSRFQGLFGFERRFSPEWYWLQNWTAILNGKTGRLPPPLIS